MKGANDCNIERYEHKFQKRARLVELIERIKNTERNGYCLLVNTSFNGESNPNDSVPSSEMHGAIEIRADCDNGPILSSVKFQIAKNVGAQIHYHF